MYCQGVFKVALKPVRLIQVTEAQPTIHNTLSDKTLSFMYSKLLIY